MRSMFFPCYRWTANSGEVATRYSASVTRVARFGRGDAQHGVACLGGQGRRDAPTQQLVGNERNQGVGITRHGLLVLDIDYDDGRSEPGGTRVAQKNLRVEIVRHRRIQVLVRELQLGGHESATLELARWGVCRYEEVEHRRREQRTLAEDDVRVLQAVLPVGRGRIVGAPQLDQAQQRFLHLARDVARCTGGRARFRIEQDRLGDGAEVAAARLPVVVEDRRNARDVAARRVTGDEALDQLARDERADVRVIEYVVERGFEVLLRCLAGRQHGKSDARVAEQPLRPACVLLRVRLHRLNLVRVGAFGL